MGLLECFREMTDHAWNILYQKEYQGILNFFSFTPTANGNPAPEEWHIFVRQPGFTEELYDKKSGKSSNETVYGVTSLSPNQANPAKILQINRGHWVIENTCHYIIDWNYNEDRSRIRTGYGPENMTRL
jgi:nucleoside-specific outer membrane channel protein Tsx